MIEAALQEMLVSAPGVRALVADRVYPSTLPQNAVLPAVTFRQISGPPVGDSNDGPSRLFRPRFEVNAWDTDYARAVAVAKAVRVLRGFRGPADAETNIQNVTLDDARFFFETDTKIHRVSQDFFLWGNE